MKKTLTIFTCFVLAVTVVLSSCQKDADPVLSPQQLSLSKTQNQHRSVTATCGTATEVDLIAGQHIVAGTVTVANTATDLLVTYTTTNGWYIKELHLYAGDCSLIPVNQKGNPIPGHFPHSNSFSGSSTTTYTYSIPLANLPDCFCVAAHAVVAKPGAGTETAWGQGTRFVPQGNWAMKFDYCEQACDPGCSFYPNPIIKDPTFYWPSPTVTIGGFVYTQVEANEIYNAPTTDARRAFIFIAAMKLSTGYLSPGAPIWADVAIVEAWLATVGKLSPANLPTAPVDEEQSISNIVNWVENNQCD